jgi:hypothetical protein
MKAIAGTCALMCAFSAGCAPQHGMHYQIMLDTSLSATQVEQVIQGGDAWMQAVPGLTLDYTVSSCNSYGEWQHTICVFLDTGSAPMSATYHEPALATTEWSHGFLAAPTSVDADSATVHVWQSTLDQQTQPDTFSNAVRHELGHAFTHTSRHIGAGNLMYGEETGLSAEGITSADVDYFWSAR